MLLEQAFTLRGGIGGTHELSLVEQDMLTAEDRAWWVKRLQKEAEARERRAREQ